MANDPLVSVIIPAFNRVKYIDQTIQCVLDQTYSNVELIVVDDGSSDGTYDKILSYGDKINVLIHPGHTNKGQSASINLGIKKAQGEYIIILDSDDYWELNKLEIQVNYLQEHKDVGLVYTNGYGVDASGDIIYPIHKKDHREINDKDLVLLDCYFSLPVNSLVRKNIYNKVGLFEEGYRAAQDHDMLIRISEITKFAYLPDFLFFYRHHEESISNNNQVIRWNNGFKILSMAQKRYAYKSSTIRKRKAVLNYRLGACYFGERRYVLSAKYLIMALIFDPVRSLKVALGIEHKN